MPRRGHDVDTQEDIDSMALLAPGASTLKNVRMREDGREQFYNQDYLVG